MAFSCCDQSAVTLLTVSDPAQKYVGQGQGQGQPRKVTIEMYSLDGGGKRRKDKARSFNDLDLVSRSSGDLPRRNLSTSMTLLDVREGMFTAQIPLNKISVTSDVTVKVIDSALELYDTVDVTSRREVKGQKSVNERRYRGTIDLPNYVDSGQVQFDIVGESLHVKAAMKGCSSRPSISLSVSNAKSTSTLDLTRLQRHDDFYSVTMTPTAS